MGSPREVLIDALLAWQREDARERLARARGDADAHPRQVVIARHAALRGPWAREQLEEARERGQLEGDAFTFEALRAAFAAVGEERGAERVREVLARRLPHDSDHHAPVTLLARMLAEPHVGRRRAMARSLEVFAPALVDALRQGEADVEESLDGTDWLGPRPPQRLSLNRTEPRNRGGSNRKAPGGVVRKHGDERERRGWARIGSGATGDFATVSQPAEPAREVLDATAARWAELSERLARTNGAPLETWSDLLFLLRAAPLDSRFDRARRWRRLGGHLAALGIRDALDQRARVERAVPSARSRAEVVALSVPGDVRILPSGMELGLASERDAMTALGRASALAFTHPALPPLAARAHSSVGAALGALFAHLLAEPRFPIAEGLGSREVEPVRALAAALELAQLRTEAAGALARAAPDVAEAARELVGDAWQVEVPQPVAAVVALRTSSERLRALRFAPALFIALRERYDEDWWRNPRAQEPIRAASERGPTFTVEMWAEELGVSGDGLDPLRARWG